LTIRNCSGSSIHGSAGVGQFAEIVKQNQLGDRCISSSKANCRVAMMISGKKHSRHAQRRGFFRGNSCSIMGPRLGGCLGKQRKHVAENHFQRLSTVVSRSAGLAAPFLVGMGRVRCQNPGDNGAFRDSVRSPAIGQ